MRINNQSINFNSNKLRQIAIYLSIHIDHLKSNIFNLLTVNQGFNIFDSTIHFLLSFATKKLTVKQKALYLSNIIGIFFI